MNAHRRPDPVTSRPVAARHLIQFRKAIRRWYAFNARPFPWRKGNTGTYRRIVVEVLLQRTRAETVAALYPRFFAAYPNWRELAATTPTRMAAIIRPLGLWRRRVPVLHALATTMVARGNRFPRTQDEISSLPGVGQYITNAILLFVWKRPAPLLDVNMARVLERVFRPRRLADIRRDPYLQSLAWATLHARDPERLNWAILDLGATVCRPTHPSCVQCPLASMCNWAMRHHSPRIPTNATLRRSLAPSGIEPTVSAKDDSGKRALPWMPDRHDTLTAILCDIDVLEMGEEGAIHLGPRANTVEGPDSPRIK